MKQCSICKQKKLLEDFRSQNTYCLQCKSLYNKDWYIKNKSKRTEQIKARREELRDKIGALKEISPCTDCNNYFPACVMDFDHIDSTNKRNNVSNLLGHTWEVIKAEIEKCELVCANCHRIRTRDRFKEI